MATPRLQRARFYTAALLAMLWSSGLCGCAHRVLKITCDEVINTGFQPNGSPLSIDIVSVFPKDLSGDEEEVNALLRYGEGITPISADVWFERKPTKESMGKKDASEWDRSRFRIDSRQIVSFTDAKPEDVYAKRSNVHGQIVGRKYWPPPDAYYEVKVPIDDIWHERSVIYVFGRFTDKDGKVLKTAPAVFWIIGDFKRDLEVRVGPKGITRVTQPTLHKDRDRGGRGE